VASADRSILVSAGFGGNIVFWDARTGEELEAIDSEQTRIQDLAISPDGRWLASAGTNRTIAVWNVETRKRAYTLTEPVETMGAIAITPDSQSLVAIGQQPSAHLWRLEDGQRQRSLDRYAWQGILHYLDFTSDSRFAYILGNAETSRLWNLQTGSTTEISDLNAFSSAVGMTPDRQQFVTAGFQLFDVASLSSQEDPVPIRLTRDWQIRGMHYFPGGDRLISISEGGFVRVWDVANKTLLRSLPTSSEIRSWAIAKQEPIVAIGMDSASFEVWNAATGQRLWYVPPVARASKIDEIAVSANGKWMAAVERILRPSASGKSPYKITVKDIKGTVSAQIDLNVVVRSLAFSPEGQRLFIGQADGAIDIWDITRRERLHRFFAHDSEVFALAVSPDGNYLASSGREPRTSEEDTRLKGAIKIWNLSNYTPIKTLTERAVGVSGLDFSPDGQTLVLDYSEISRLWQWRANIPPLQTRPRDNLTLHPNGKAIAGTSGRDKSILHIWQASDLLQ
ncbi:MAG: WD40 repeat domain-containing protein, partial [Cyanobacteria bacterium J06639_1]